MRCSALALPAVRLLASRREPADASRRSRHAPGRAEELGFDSLWLSDHLFLDLEKYGGTAERFGAYEPLATLAALARCRDAPAARHARALRGAAPRERARQGPRDPRPHLRRPPRRRPRRRLVRTRLRGDRHGDAAPRRARSTGCAKPWKSCAASSAASRSSFDGRYHRADGAVVDPPARQRPHPPVFIGGKGDRVIRTAVDIADGWNTCWVMEPASYRARLEVVERACEAIGPRPGDRSGGHWVSTRCAARTRPTWPGASNGCASGRRRASSTACRSTSGGSGGSWAPSNRCGSRPRPGPSSAWRRDPRPGLRPVPDGGP